MTVGQSTAWDVTQFLYREALALDERRFRDWLAMLADDIRYEVPVRVTREGLADWELAPTSRIFDEDKQTLEVRVRRLETDFAWAEQPPSRTRHFVTNVIVDETDVDGEYLVHSNVFIYRSRGIDPTPACTRSFARTGCGVPRTASSSRSAGRRSTSPSSMRTTCPSSFDVGPPDLRTEVRDRPHARGA